MPTLQLSAPVRQNFLAKRLGHVSRILPGAWTILEQDFATHPPTYIVDVQPGPEKCAESGEELSHSCQTFGGTIPASGAHCRRGDLSDALGLVS